MADQAPVGAQRIATFKSGERVILDSGVATQNIMLAFYWSINLGAFLKIGTTCKLILRLVVLFILDIYLTHAEKHIGFWLAYLVPLIVYFIMPLFLVITYKPLVKLPPQGSVIYDAFKVGNVLLSRGDIKKISRGGDDFWSAAKPVN